jgi:hypothetical protein
LTRVVEATATPVGKFRYLEQYAREPKAGAFPPQVEALQPRVAIKGRLWVNNIIYIVGLVVVVIAVLSFFGLR